MPIKPTTLDVRAEYIPGELKAGCHWVVWQWEWREKDKKWTKPPFMVTGAAASVTDPTTWTSFDTAWIAYRNTPQFAGLGYVLVGDGLVGLDFDRCRDPLTGTVDERIFNLLLSLDTYTEISPSGYGIRAWCHGKLPPSGRRRGKLEIYETARYLTCTGHVREDFPTAIQERTAELAALHAEIFGTRVNGGSARRDQAPELDDTELRDKAMAAKDGAKFSTLWAGDHSAYDSRSEADLALCALLSFWAGKDAVQIDRMFRQSGLHRAKWDEKRGAQTYGELTIAKAIAECQEVYRPGLRKKGKQAARPVLDPDDPAMDLEEDVHVQNDQDQAARRDPPVNSYVFQPAFVPEHFVSQYIELVSIRTDAASEYAEAAALLLIAIATPGVRARLNIFPGGLGTNLYLLVLGRSTRSRKSTVLRATTDLLERSSLALNLLPDKMSPEAFVEQMAQREGRGALWPVDEFGPMLGKFHHAAYMEDFVGNLLSAYDGKGIHAARRSKRNKETGRTERDQDQARHPHLSLYALSTPALLFKRLLLEDIASGLLPRFGIIYPLTKPSRHAITRVEESLEDRERLMIRWLNRLAEWNDQGGSVILDDSALAAINVFDEQHEARQEARDHDDVASLMFERHVAMLVKLTLLSAIGRSDLGTSEIIATAADVAAAQIVLTRWATFTTTFVGQLGETEHEGHIKKASALLEKYGSRARRDLSRSLKLSKRQLDDIEATMEDRGLIQVDGSTWQWQGEK